MLGYRWHRRRCHQQQASHWIVAGLAEDAAVLAQSRRGDDPRQQREIPVAITAEERVGDVVRRIDLDKFLRARVVLFKFCRAMVLKYRDGMFLPVPGMASLDRLAQQAKAQDVFLVLLKRFTLENRNVAASPGRSYAPALFAGEDEAKKAHLKKSDLKDAMKQLFKDQRIWNEPYGVPSRRFYRVAIKL
jgi:hypothetical protein